MSTEVKFRRGTTAEHNSFVGATGEMTVDTTKDTLVAHDGSTTGGFPMLREDLNNLSIGSGLSKSGGTLSLDSDLSDIAALTPSDGVFIVGNGSEFITESGATVRASLGLTIGTNVQAFDAELSTLSGMSSAQATGLVGASGAATFNAMTIGTTGKGFDSSGNVSGTNASFDGLNINSSSSGDILINLGVGQVRNLSSGIWITPPDGSQLRIGPASSSATFDLLINRITNFEVQSNTTIGGDLTAEANLFVEGTADIATAQIDTLRTTLFKPNSINGMGGEFAFTAVSKVVSITESDATTGTIIIKDAVFSDNDLLVVSSGTYDEAGFIKVELELTSTGSAVATGTQYSYTANSGDPTDIEEGFTVVRAGNNTTPTDLIYVDATEGGDSPSIKGYDGIDSFANSPLSGGGASPVWQLNATGGNIGGYDFDGDKFSATGLTLMGGASPYMAVSSGSTEMRIDGSKGVQLPSGAGSQSAGSIKWYETNDWADDTDIITAINVGGNGDIQILRRDTNLNVVAYVKNDSVEILKTLNIIQSELQWTGYATSDQTDGKTLYVDTGDGNTIKMSSTPPSAPSTPTGLTLQKSRANDQMYISWNAVSGADTYDLQRSTDDATWTDVTVDTPNTDAYNNTPFNNKSTTYFYRVRASNAGGDSAWSSSVSDSWNDADNKESLNPTSVNFTQSTFNSEILWDTPLAGNPDDYQLQYKIDSGSFNVLASGVSGSATSYNFDVCSYGNNTEDITIRVIANYSDPSETGQGDSVPTEISVC